MDEARGAAPARAALAGNPSDGYGGAVLAVTLDQLEAEALARRAPRLLAEPASELVEATVRRFAKELEPAAQATAVRWATSIPRGVGLGGSSAIVVSVLGALCELYGVRLKPARLASMALAVETEDLGIAAGLQDRVAQAYGGLVFMDFAAGERYEPLDPDLLPPLVVAWRDDAPEHSGGVHASLAERWRRGDPAVVAGMEEVADLARTARTALLTDNRARFAHAVDSTFAVRRRLLELDPRHVEMIDRARALGAGANYTGSGGAIVAVCIDGVHAAGVRQEFEEMGCGTLRR
jgi:glucuronokinase